MLIKKQWQKYEIIKQKRKFNYKPNSFSGWLVGGWVLACVFDSGEERQGGCRRYEAAWLRGAAK